MNQFQYSSARPLAAQTESANDILWVTYRWMSVGLGITGLVAWLVSQSPDGARGRRRQPHRLLRAALRAARAGLRVQRGRPARVEPAVAAAMFFALRGADRGSRSRVIFLVYTASSIASTFFVTAGAFAGLSVFGAVTKRDLSRVGRFAVFALIGLIIASVVNIFLHSTGLDVAHTFAGVLIFAALTAYDTQKLKAMYASGSGRQPALRGRADALPRLHQHVPLPPPPLRPAEPELEPWASRPEPWASCPEPWASCPEPWASCPEPWASCPEPWASCPEPWASCPEPWARYPEPRARYPEPWAPGQLPGAPGTLPGTLGTLPGALGTTPARDLADLPNRTTIPACRPSS